MYMQREVCRFTFLATQATGYQTTHMEPFACMRSSYMFKSYTLSLKILPKDMDQIKQKF